MQKINPFFAPSNYQACYDLEIKVTNIYPGFSPLFCCLLIVPPNIYALTSVKNNCYCVGAAAAAVAALCSYYLRCSLHVCLWSSFFIIIC